MGLSVLNISKTYGTQLAVNNISFDIAPGEIVGFIGPNGSGKSTTMKSICGIIQPDCGSILLDGTDINLNPSLTKEHIGYLAEHNPLYTDMYVIEYLEHIARLYKVKNKKERIQEVIQLTGLENEKTKKIMHLSKGYRQRIGIAQAIMHDPQLLILDEPTTGLDPNQILEIRELISELAKNKSVLLSTHILQEVEAICDRVILINKGKLIVDEKTSDMAGRGDTKNQVLFIELKEQVEKEIFSTCHFLLNVKKLSEQSWLLESKDQADIREDMFNFAKEMGLHLLSMQIKESTLEDTFKELTTE